MSIATSKCKLAAAKSGFDSVLRVTAMHGGCNYFTIQ